VSARAWRARLLGIEATVAAGTAIRSNVDQTGHEPFDDPAWQRSRRAGKLAIRALMFCWRVLHAHGQNVAYGTYGHSIFFFPCSRPLSAITTRWKIKSCLSPCAFPRYFAQGSIFRSGLIGRRDPGVVNNMSALRIRVHTGKTSNLTLPGPISVLFHARAWHSSSCHFEVREAFDSSPGNR
jgi:hypothetical protein